MSTPNPTLPNQAAPVTLSELREALAFMTEQYDKLADTGTNVLVWLWEAIQGDFNQERTTGQVVFDTAISMIPGVDQVCDVRDIVGNCRQINEDKSNAWAWVALGLTLIGLFPTLGSLVKGVLKLFFLFVRRSGGKAVMEAVEQAMTWVITFLRKREVQKYWKALEWDHVFGELAKQVRKVRAQVNLGQLLKAFDRGIVLMKSLLGQVKHIPFVGTRAQEIIDMVVGIRKLANDHLGNAIKPLQDALDVIVRRLELEDIVQRGGIVNAGNIHFRGNIPEAQAVSLMRTADPSPIWLSKGGPTYPELNPTDAVLQRRIANSTAKGHSKPSNKVIGSFHRMEADEIKGPAKLYRIVSPSNGAMSESWMSDEVFQRIMNSPDPKAAWRQYLAVWPDWNGNGQFVVMEIPKGESVKVWRGEAASQTKKTLEGKHLEGGWEQIVYTPKGNEYDTMRVYQRVGNSGALKPVSMPYLDYLNLPPSKKHAYMPIREKINDPRIKGPFDTGWGATDFDPQLQDAKIGLPALPGLLSNAQGTH